MKEINNNYNVPTANFHSLARHEAGVSSPELHNKHAAVIDDISGRAVVDVVGTRRTPRVDHPHSRVFTGTEADLYHALTPDQDR